MSHRHPVRWLVVVTLLLVGAQSVSARYIRPEIKEVPVQQLVKKLEAQAVENPDDASLRLNLARLHAMAYALKTSTTSVLKDKEELGAWFGFEPKYVPFEIKDTEDAKIAKTAKAHLEQAILEYKKAIAIDDQNLTAQLGLGWCLKEAGKEEQAVVQLRKTIDMGWGQEKKLELGSLGGHYITVEAAEYLMPLLDEVNDAKEIDELKERTAQLSELPRPVTPIAIPLTGNLQAADIRNPAAKVSFDADGTGRQQEWNWIHNNAGWLVYDRSGDGRVTSALQMFGSVTFWLFWDDGYQALAALDRDGDGELTGAELEHLAVWRDENENGVSETGEVRTLAEYGIVAVSCTGTASNEEGVIASNSAGIRFEDGSTRATFDLMLEVTR